MCQLRKKLHFEQQNSVNFHIAPTKTLTKAEICPCVEIDICPWIYGQSALYITLIGFVLPCTEKGTVRCCGVTVSVFLLLILQCLNSIVKFSFFIAPILKYWNIDTAC